MHYRQIFSIYLLIVLFCMKAHCQQQEAGDTIALELKYHSGYGPFLVGGLMVTGEDPQKESAFSNTFLPVKGIPETWHEVKKKMIIIDYQQFLYQNIKCGHITAAQLEQLKEAGWKIDSCRVFPGFIKCYVYAVAGITEDNRPVAKIDQNNNLDFSDDPIQYPLDMSLPTAELEKKIVYARYERNLLGKQQQDTVPLLLLLNEHNTLFYSIPTHAIAVLKQDGLDYPIVAGAQMTTSGTFNNTQIALWDGQKRNFHPDSTTKLGEVLLINGTAYENLGVEMRKNKLLLRKRKHYSDIVSTSPGYKAISFSGTEFTPGKAIKLEEFRGKYVYLDFWGTWCAPCVADMPDLKKLYSSLDHNKIEFIGVAVNQKPELLKAFLEKTGVSWPKIISDSVADAYKVTYFPTTFLIDPEGRIIAKDLRGQELQKKLLELL